MTATLAAVLSLAVCGFLLPREPRPAERRLARHLATARQRPSSRPHACSEHGCPKDRCLESTTQRRDLLMQRAAAALTGLVCFAMIGGLAGCAAGTVVAVLVLRAFKRLGQAGDRHRRARLVADLPVAVDLLAACLRGGTPWSEAVDAVAEAIGGPLGAELRGVAVQIRLGVDPASAWFSLSSEPLLAPLARTAVRAAQSGAGPAPSLTRLARDQRRTARTAAAARARSAAIRALAPLGLCFLPAFVLLGVVPAIAGIASTILLP